MKDSNKLLTTSRHTDGLWYIYTNFESPSYYTENKRNIMWRESNEGYTHKSYALVEIKRLYINEYKLQYER